MKCFHVIASAVAIINSKSYNSFYQHSAKVCLITVLDVQKHAGDLVRKTIYANKKNNNKNVDNNNNKMWIIIRKMWKSLFSQESTTKDVKLVGLNKFDFNTLHYLLVTSSPLG